MSKLSISQTIKDTILASQASDFKIQVMEVDKDHIHLLQVTTAQVWFTNTIELRKHFWKKHIFWSSGYFVCSTGDASTVTIAKYISEQG